MDKSFPMWLTVLHHFNVVKEVMLSVLSQRHAIFGAP